VPAKASVSPGARTMGRDLLHPHRAWARAWRGGAKRAARQREAASQTEATVAQAQRRGQETRGLAGAAGRAWRKAAALCAAAVHAHEAVAQSQAALAWFEARGALESRQTAQAQRDEALATRQEAGGRKATRLRSEARALRPLARLNAQCALAVPAPSRREALTPRWYLRQARRGAAGAARGR